MCQLASRLSLLAWVTCLVLRWAIPARPPSQNSDAHPRAPIELQLFDSVIPIELPQAHRGGEAVDRAADAKSALPKALFTVLKSLLVGDIDAIHPNLSEDIRGDIMFEDHFELPCSDLKRKRSVRNRQVGPVS
jgi:hypothetical protein